MSPTPPPADATGLDQPILPPAPPPNVQGPALYSVPGPPSQYGRTGPYGSQYHAAGMGMNTPPQLYYGAHPPFYHHGDAGPWGYGHYPPGAFPNPVPHPGGLQSSSAPVQARVMPMHAKEGASQAGLQSSSAPVQASEATNEVARSAFQPKRNYPNKQISEGGTSRSI